MRYSNQEVDLVNKLKNDLDPDQIRNILIDNGYRKRTVESVAKKVSELQKKDDLKERRKQYAQNYAKNNPIKYRARTLLTGAYNRSKRKNLPFDLSLQWIVDRLTEGRCEVTRLPLEIKPYSVNGNLEKVNPFAPSLDRIDSSKGYTEDNVQVVVWAYNRMKGDSCKKACLKVAKALCDSHDV